MKFNELKEQSVHDIERVLATSRDEVRELRFAVVIRQEKKVRDIRKKRKLIAQSLTLLTQKSKEANNK
ncbi:MAG: 50S ribosomal protein L29 [bacterium]|nr:50S ribosomal protein L29 [bacterium]